MRKLVLSFVVLSLVVSVSGNPLMEDLTDNLSSDPSERPYDSDIPDSEIDYDVEEMVRSNLGIIGGIVIGGLVLFMLVKKRDKIRDYLSQYSPTSF